MLQQESQYTESLVSWFNFLSNKTLSIFNTAYIDMLYSHDIVMNFSKRKISHELASLKEQILQKWFSSQLDDQDVFMIMNAAEKLAYNLEDLTNKILITFMFSLEYCDLIESENTQWNTVIMLNNSQCNIKFSALKSDFYLVYLCDSTSFWTIKQNNVVNHLKIQLYSQSAKHNTFLSLSFELKTEFTDEVLITVKMQAVNSRLHSVNLMLWFFKKTKTTNLTEVNLMQNTVFFSIVTSHRQIIVYIHWLNFEKKCFYMSYLQFFLTFETDSIWKCNNTIKNMIDNAQKSQKIKIEEALITLEFIIESLNFWSIIIINSSTLSIFFSEDLRSFKWWWDSQV